MVLRAAKGIVNHPKNVAGLVDLANLSGPLREFIGQSQISRLGCFLRVWSYIKENGLQDPSNKNVVNCDDKLKGILLGSKLCHVTLHHLLDQRTTSKCFGHHVFISLNADH